MSKAARNWTEKNLRVPTRLVSIMLLGFGLTLLFFIAYAGWSMNRASHSGQAALIDSAITQRANQTLMEQKSIALWDIAAAEVHKLPGETGFFDREIGAFLTEGYGHDQVYVLDRNDRLVYGYAVGQHLDKESYNSFAPQIAPLVRAIRTGKPTGFKQRDRLFGLMQSGYQYLDGARQARWASNVLKGPDGPVIVSVITIVPTTRVLPKGLHPYLLVSVLKLDDAMFHLIGNALQLDGLHFQRTSAGGHAFITDDGRRIGSIGWDAPTPGHLLLHYALPAFALLLLLASVSTRRIFRSLLFTQNRLREQEANARFMAMHDGLSQLPNRRHFNQVLRERLEAARADPSIRICVAYVDVDHFKNVNDAIGHGAGDALVMQIGPRLIAALRHEDLLARLGGDEFAVMRQLGPGDSAEELGRTLLSVFKRPFDIGMSQIEVTASVGVAVAAPGETDPDRVVQDADISLYQSKDSGRNRFTIFHAAMADEVRIRHELEKDLRSAIGTDQILMHYQPIISVNSGKVSGVEALVRWQHPTRGMIAPDRFISLAERTGLMVPLGDHILEIMLREAHRFGDLDVAINLSPLQLRQRTLPDRVVQLCRRFNVDHARITLEVTESMMLESGGAGGATYEELCALGFRTALDDFGTGYSSLGYLHKFRFNKIKIDRSFISAGSLARMRPIIEAIVHIGRGLRMEIVAEGVESAAELAVVRALGCTEAQGYGISRPLPIDDIVAFIESMKFDPNLESPLLSVING